MDCYIQSKKNSKEEVGLQHLRRRSIVNNPVEFLVSPLLRFISILKRLGQTLEQKANSRQIKRCRNISRSMSTNFMKRMNGILGYSELLCVIVGRLWRLGKMWCGRDQTIILIVFFFFLRKKVISESYIVVLFG